MIRLALITAALCSAQTFYAAGVTMLPQSSPKTQAWFAIATQVSSKEGIWSFTESDYTPIRTNGQWRLQSSPRTGIATFMRAFGRSGLYALADAGAATSGPFLGGAYAGGGFLLTPLRNRWYAITGVRLLRTAIGGTQAYAEVGIGRE